MDTAGINNPIYRFRDESLIARREAMKIRKTPSFELITFILGEAEGMSLRAVSELWRGMGVDVCHETLNKLLQSMSWAKAVRLYQSKISRNAPHALKRKQKNHRPKRDKLHRLECLKTYHAPEGFEDAMQEILLPVDWKNLEKMLAQKASNCRRDGIPCSLDIFHMLLMCAAYRLYTGDRSNFWKKARAVDICRYQDKNGYTIFNSVIRLHSENTTYARNRHNTTGDDELQQKMAQTDEHVRSQIEVQLELQDLYFLSHKRHPDRPAFSVVFVDDVLILISDNIGSGQTSALDNGAFVIHRLREAHGLMHQKVFCRTRRGSFVELMYLAEGFVMNSPLLSETQRTFLESCSHLKAAPLRVAHKN